MLPKLHVHAVLSHMKTLKQVLNHAPDNLIKNFKVIKKYRGKLECLIYEMLWIRNKRLKLNTQADSICEKLFTWANALMLIYFFSLSKSINMPFHYF